MECSDIVPKTTKSENEKGKNITAAILAIVPGVNDNALNINQFLHSDQIVIDRKGNSLIRSFASHAPKLILFSELRMTIVN